MFHQLKKLLFMDLKVFFDFLFSKNCLDLKYFLVNKFLGKDECGIPSQFPVQEDTQFLQLLRESLDFFGIEEKLQTYHYLVDYKSRKNFLLNILKNQFYLLFSFNRSNS